MTDENRIQREQAERTGRTDEVGGESKTFKADKKIPGPHDFEGPAGDPAEGKPVQDNYPA